MRRDEQGLPVSSCEAWSGFIQRSGHRGDWGQTGQDTRDVRTEPDSAAKPIGLCTHLVDVSAGHKPPARSVW